MLGCLFNLFCVVQESVQLTDGLSLVKQTDAPSAVAEPRFYPGTTAEEKVDSMLFSKFEQLISTHTISMDLAEGRGRGIMCKYLHNYYIKRNLIFICINAFINNTYYR